MITYNKEYRKKDGRLLTASGPRALQNRPAYSDSDIETLKDEIDRLKASLSGDSFVKPNVVHDNIDINDLINEAVGKALLEVETANLDKIKDYEQKIESLNREIIRLNTELSFIKSEHRSQLEAAEDRLSKMFAIVSEKDGIISGITDKMFSNGTFNNSVVNANENTAVSDEVVDVVVKRPGIDSVYIDPNKGGEDAMKSHVKIKEVKNDTNVSDSVDKLRGLLGKSFKK